MQVQKENYAKFYRFRIQTKLLNFIVILKSLFNMSEFFFVVVAYV